MEIKARAMLDPEAIKALTHLAMFKREDPKKRMRFFTIAYAILLAVLILESVLLGPEVILWVLMGAMIFVYMLQCYVYFIVPKIKYKAMAKLKDAENEYIFGDNTVKVSSRSPEYNGEGEIEYSLFVRALETSRYFFLYQTRNQVLIVDKTTVVDGTVEEIRRKLIDALKDKYIICKY